ncbi:protein lplB [Clostridia bacterium]|nr:protein lplB [Clostridia bacterium]
MHNDIAVKVRKPAYHEKKDWKLFWMALPFAAFIVAFYYAQLFGWLYAFTDYKPSKDVFHQTYVGLKYLKKLFEVRSRFPVAFRNTLIYGFLNIIASPIALIFAVLLNEISNSRIKRTIQTMTSFPNFISWILVYAIAFMFFSSEGQINNLLVKVGIMSNTRNLLSNANATYIFQLVLGIWKSTGWSAIIYLSAIAGIDQELYDAADADGANRFQKMLHITVVGLQPTFFTLLILSIGGIMNAGFEQFYVFYNPMVSEQIEVIATYAYRIGIGSGEIPFGTAIGMTQSLISIVLLLLVNRLAHAVSGSSII